MALTQVSKDVLNSSQANITQVGTLVDLTVSGNISSANYNYANGVSITTPIASALATLTSNAAVQAGNIATIFANLSSVSGSIATLTANAGTQSASIATLTSNAAVQAGLIADTNTAITTANTAMKGYVDAINSTLTANAGAQAGSISSLTSNAAVQAGAIATLTSNAGAQAGSISTLETSKASLSGAAFTGNISTTANVKFAGWQIYEISNTLYFAHNGAVKMSLNTSGNLTVTGDIAGFGTP
jgi:hypothetical protein